MRNELSRSELGYVIVPATRHNYDKKCKIKPNRSLKKGDFDFIKYLYNDALFFIMSINICLIFQRQQESIFSSRATE